MLDVGEQAEDLAALGASTARTPKPCIHGRIADGGGPKLRLGTHMSGKRHNARIGG